MAAVWDPIKPQPPVSKIGWSKFIILNKLNQEIDLTNLGRCISSI